MERIEGQFTAIEAAALQAELEGTITLAQDAADAAQTAADAADTAAAAAQVATDASQALQDLINSTTTGCTITATDAGANVTVAVSAHTRVYGDGASVAVTGGNITGLGYTASLFIFYDQSSRAGGAVTFQAATSIVDAKPSTADPDRHYVGAIYTPAAAAPPNTGTQALYGQVEVPPNIGFQYS